MAATSQTALNEIPVGRVVQIERVPDENPELLRNVAELGLVPTTTVTIVEYHPEQQTLTVAIGKPSATSPVNAGRQQRSVPYELAKHIFVRTPGASES